MHAAAEQEASAQAADALRRLGALRGMPKRRGASVLSAGAADGDDAGRHGGGDAYLAAKHP